MCVILSMIFGGGGGGGHICEFVYTCVYVCV